MLDLIYQQTNELRGFKKEIGESFSTFPDSVPGAGVEPARVLPHRCLRPARLPIPPSGHFLKGGAKVADFFLKASVFIFKKYLKANLISKQCL